MSGLDRMFAKVVLASKPFDTSSTALPLITMHLHYPDIIHGEVMTHRVFSRNARSMRAVPVKTMVKEVREDPFVPWHWGKNQKGMQADEECNELVRVYVTEDVGGAGLRDNETILVPKMVSRETAWRMEAAHAAAKAESYDASGYHKQVANRLIAPYTWKHTLISSTSWANFLHLRDHEDAEPHFHDLAAMVREAIAGASYQFLKNGDWHLPYVTKQELLVNGLEVCRKLSVARSARISYAPFDGDFSIAREIERYELLVGSSPLHASPTEHQATPDRHSDREVTMAKWGGWEPNDWENPQLAGNFGPGWIQFRKTLEGEYVSDRIAA